MKEEKRLNSPYMKQMRELWSQSNLYFDKIAAEEAKEKLFYEGSQWKIRSTLKIKLP